MENQVKGSATAFSLRGNRRPVVNGFVSFVLSYLLQKKKNKIITKIKIKRNINLETILFILSRSITNFRTRQEIRVKVFPRVSSCAGKPIQRVSVNEFVMLDRVRMGTRSRTCTATDKTWQVASLRGDIAHVSSPAFAYQSPVKCETIAGRSRSVDRRLNGCSRPANPLSRPIPPPSLPISIFPPYPDKRKRCWNYDTHPTCFSSKYLYP